MSLLRGALAISIALACTAGGPATDRQRLPQTQSGTATITGTVATLSSGEPVADASVTLYGSTLPDGRVSTATDTEGRFQFTNLSAGRYTVGAVKTGFVNVVFGERHYGRGGRAFPLRDAEHRDIRLQLPRPGVITGTIVDEHGNPSPHASLRALRFSMAFGYRRAMPAGMATTDSQGIFRIESLTPGDYAVCASTRETAPLNQAQRLQMEIDRQRRNAAFVLGPQGVEAQKALAPHLAALEGQLPPFVLPVRGYPPICYPGNTSTPSMITLVPEEERTGVNMQLGLARLARVEGIVKGMPPDGRGFDPIILFSGDELREGMGQDSVRPDVDGLFSFTNVFPGRYRLFLRGASGVAAAGPPVHAEADVVVLDEDIRNLVLDIQPGVTVSGHLVFRGSAPPPAAEIARAGLEIRLDPADPGPLNRYPGPLIARPDATGQFVIRDVFPGDYRISATQRELTGWFFDPTTVRGADGMGQVVKVKRQDLPGVAVTLTDEGAELSGTIMTNTGEPAPEYYILVYPTDQKYWTPYSRRLYGARAKPDGTFVITGVRAGSYRLATLLDAEFGAWFDPAFLRRIDADSTALSIAREQRKVLHLRVPGDR